jgi:hypothetical protein
MRKDFHRGRLPLCHTAAGRLVDTFKPTVDRDTVINAYYDKGRLRGGPSFVSVGVIRLITLTFALQFTNQAL